jgi:hypothetical protein
MQDSITNPRQVHPQQRKECATIFIAIAWNIWLAKNRMVFDNAAIPAGRMEENRWDTISLWANRCKKASRKKAIMDWKATNGPVGHRV